MTPAVVKRKLASLTRQSAEISAKIGELRRNCPHANLTYKYVSYVGNYPESDDCYWTNWHCVDCENSWQTDQSREHNNKYPQAKNITK